MPAFDDELTLISASDGGFSDSAPDLPGDTSTTAILEPDVPFVSSFFYDLTPGDGFIDADSDWFRANLVAGQSYLLQLEDFSGTGEPKTLYDSNGQTIRSLDEGGFGSAPFSVSETGLYFLSVSTLLYSVTGDAEPASYTLTLVTLPPDPVIAEGTPANDMLTGAAGNDSLHGGDGDDTLTGLDGDDRLIGDAGNDRLDGGLGADTLNGGDGDDIILGGPAADDLRDVIYAGEGNDSVDAGAGNDLVYGQGGSDTIAGGFGVDELQGQDGDDVITGSAFSDLVFGGAGNDFVNGGFGHDRINGGTGADKFFHVGVEGHGSDWVQDYSAAEGDVLLLGNTAATRDDFQVNFAHTENAEGERAGDDAVMEAFLIYHPTGQIMWALVDGEGQSSINLQIGGDVFDLLA